MPRFETTLDVDAPAIVYTPKRVSYERRPIDGDAQVHPFIEAAICGVAGMILAASFVMVLRLELRWLWVAALLASALFLSVYVWRLQVRDDRTLYEREVTTDLPGEQLRPTVTEGARGETIRRGNFTMSREYWVRLYNAFQDGTPLSRDGVVKARGMPRDLYHGDGWQPTLAELRRVGLIDNENRMTTAWRDFHAVAVTRSRRSFVPTQNATDDDGAG